MELSKRERRKLRLEKLRNESRQVQQEFEQKQHHQIHDDNNNPKKSKYYVIAAVAGLLILIIASYSVYSLNKPSPYDDFAKCLTEKGAVMYGALDWCKFTQAQKAMFGNSFKYVNYHEYQELTGIKKTPTWVINGQWYENTQSFEKLSAITGCKF